MRPGRNKGLICEIKVLNLDFRPQKGPEGQNPSFVLSIFVVVFQILLIFNNQGFCQGNHASAVEGSLDRRWQAFVAACEGGSHPRPGTACAGIEARAADTAATTASMAATAAAAAGESHSLHGPQRY